MDFAEPTAVDGGAALEALRQLHAAGYLHGDLESGNILLSRDGDGGAVAKLLDLGHCVAGAAAEALQEEERQLAALFDSLVGKRSPAWPSC